MAPAADDVKVLLDVMGLGQRGTGFHVYLVILDYPPQWDVFESFVSDKRDPFENVPHWEEVLQGR